MLERSYMRIARDVVRVPPGATLFLGKIRCLGILLYSPCLILVEVYCIYAYITCSSGGCRMDTSSKLSLPDKSSVSWHSA